MTNFEKFKEDLTFEEVVQYKVETQTCKTCELQTECPNDCVIMEDGTAPCEFYWRKHLEKLVGQITNFNIFKEKLTFEEGVQYKYEMQPCETCMFNTECYTDYVPIEDNIEKCEFRWRNHLESEVTE